MYIIVVGGGKIGYSLCRALLDEGHEVLIIEKDPARCEQINEDVGAVCMTGDGAETSTLSDAGAARADMIVSTTSQDEDNLVVCQVAKHKFAIPRTIALVNNPKNESIFKKLGIDCAVSATNVILEHIQEAVPTHVLVHLIKMDQQGIQVVEVKIPPHSPAIGKRIDQLPIPPTTLLSALIRKDSLPTLPRPDTVVMDDDRFIAVVIGEMEKQLRAALTGS